VGIDGPSPTKSPKLSHWWSSIAGSTARSVGALKEIGVSSVVAVSGDDRERAAAAVEGWDLSDLPVAYGQTVDSMREWGLFVSKGLNEGEPALFGEPGLFLIRADGTLYASVVNSMPFGRPHLDEIVGAIRWVTDNAYPARGEA
jgi:hypothetical protein